MRTEWKPFHNCEKSLLTTLLSLYHAIRGSWFCIDAVWGEGTQDQSESSLCQVEQKKCSQICGCSSFETFFIENCEIIISIDAWQRKQNGGNEDDFSFARFSQETFANVLLFFSFFQSFSHLLFFLISFSDFFFVFLFLISWYQRNKPHWIASKPRATKSLQQVQAFGSEFQKFAGYVLSFIAGDKDKVTKELRTESLAWKVSK